ncbi:MAG: hypothetical protein M5U05_19470 [Anaerolineales bacterium]|nr:hypothetical protein [Anaerolineales bacterium]
MLKIKDIVELDTRGEFRSDVQLSDYDKASLNRSLLQSYIFSVSTPSSFGGKTQSIAALGLLDELLRAFRYDKFDNRFVAIANYGHGKSHLALVLANYFARPTASPEVTIVLDRIEQALNNPAKAQGYREFKEERGEFLVLRLRGDDPRPLREQFFRALKQALAEHDQTRGIELPFWEKQAGQYLRSLAADQLEKANAFLERYGLDVPALAQEVGECRQQAYERYVELFAHLSAGIQPNLEGHVSLREAMGWVVGEYCGRGKPLGGLLILFDEFSLYVQRYARDKAAGELQDLLQGIEDHRESAAFLAFGQHDPDEVATQALSGGQLLQSLRKELERLPKRFALYSLMESVLDSYLKQSPAAWDEFLQDRTVKGMIWGQTETTWDLFVKHYDEELGWTNQKFREAVTQGCFPLHPTTTALLCQVKMQQGESIGAARTVLGFVRDQLEHLAEKPAHDGGQVHWILPIALVDYFERRLTGDTPALYEAFVAAQRSLEQVLGEDATEVHRKILKALLLQEVARLPGRNRKQAALLAHLSGLDEQVALQALKELSQNNTVIRYDPIHGANSFWPVGIDPKRLEQAIREETERIRLKSINFVAELDQWLRNDPALYEFGSVKLDVDWGHQDDWAAEEYVFSTEAPEIVPSFALNAKGLQDGIRGVVAWMFLRDESERDALRERAQNFVVEQGASSGSAETPLPVIVMLPKEPVPELEELFVRLKALEAVGKNKDLLGEIGQQTYRQEFERTKVELSRALRRLRGNTEHIWDIRRSPGEIVVHQAYQAAVAASGYGLSVKNVLKQLYDMAYRHRPPEFFRQYQFGRSNVLNRAVKNVAKNLLHDNIGNALKGMDNVSKDLCEKYLVSKWGVLTQTWGTLAPHALQKPTSLKLQPAWDLLDRTFQPGTQDIAVGEVIPKLLNPPYGFDYNTAMLLLSGWLGYHRSELRLSRRGEQIGFGELERQIETAKTSRDFLNWGCVNVLAISRRDPDAALKEMREIRRRVSKGENFSQEDASQALLALDEFTENERNPADQRQQAAEIAGRLRKAIEAAQKYDEEAREILTGLNVQLEVTELLKLRSKLMKLASSEQVTVTQPAIHDIEARIFEKLEQALEKEHRLVEGLADITQVGALEQRLRALKKQLTQQGLGSHADQLATIESALDERIRLLKAAEQEAAIQNEIEAMTVDAGLPKLYDYRQRLQEIQLISPDLRQVHDRKQEAIGREILGLEKFAADIIDRAHSADLTSVQQIQKEIIRCQSRYQGAEHEQIIGQALDYLETLQQFRSELKSVMSQLRLIVLEDVQAAQERTEQIASDFRQKLSPQHLQELISTSRELEQRIQQEQRRAAQWLEEREREASQPDASLSAIQQKLQRAPAFLPADCQTRLDTLRARVQEGLDRDYIAQIEFLFRSLGTPDKRKECLNRLLQLVADKV